jgi:translation initiation factor IF-2
MTNDTEKTLGVGKTLSLKKPLEGGRQPQGTVTVEVKRRRPLSINRTEHENTNQSLLKKNRYQPDPKKVNSAEFESRLKVLQEAKKNQVQEQETRTLRERDLDRLRQEQRDLNRVDEPKIEEIVTPVIEKNDIKNDKVEKSKPLPIIEPVVEVPVEKNAKERRDHKIPQKVSKKEIDTHEEVESVTYRAESMKKKSVAVVPPKRTVTVKVAPKKLSKQLISRVLDDNFDEKERSLAAVRRHRQKMLKQSILEDQEAKKIVREVIIPEAITVGELAARMAIRAAEVIKSLMKLGILANVNQSIDADTAELVCTEFGHTPKRVRESDFEDDLKGAVDLQETLQGRAPVVTIMGHVDHGKTSLLDALRSTDVVSGEAGGITQHIGAYQVTLGSGKKITFIDTPGHAAFSEMRSRGANITDIVILVVAADDGIMEQTIEAINHAKAAGVPIVIAINKMDKPNANPDRIRQELMNHEILLEEFGGDIMSVEISAKEKMNLDKLEDTILLLAEMQDLKANPNRTAQGVIIESRIDKGRGVIATTLIQRGTLKIGDIYVAGTEWGKVRALVNDHGRPIKEAYPSQPVEILGFNKAPFAGDEFMVVKDEAEAREATERRMLKKRDDANKAVVSSTIEQMMGQIAAGQRKEVAVVIKADVHGSLEAIRTTLSKLGNDEIAVRILHGGVGAINESDITLSTASAAIILGFNVRANPQAKALATKEGIEIRYYSIIYKLIDDMKAIMGGLLAPDIHEEYVGQAEIRVIFNVPKVGKAAGCMVKDGMIKRGAKVRLLRDNVVIHEGTLKFLRRFKDEVKEVKEGYECGVSFENYQDLKEGDTIECFNMKEVAREL